MINFEILRFTFVLYFSHTVYVFVTDTVMCYKYWDKFFFVAIYFIQNLIFSKQRIVVISSSIFMK